MMVLLQNWQRELHLEKTFVHKVYLGIDGIATESVVKVALKSSDTTTDELLVVSVLLVNLVLLTCSF